MGSVVAWCAWLVEQTDLDLTLFWSSYASAIGDQALDESLALMEAHTHVILVGELTDRLAIQRDHAIREGISLIDLTSFGSTPPAVGEASMFLRDVIHNLASVTLPSFKDG